MSPAEDNAKAFIFDRLSQVDVVCFENIELLVPKARRWRRVAVGLTVLAAALAAAAGATGLSDALTKTEIGLLGLASAIVAAVNLGLGAGAVAEDEQKAVQALITLRADVDSWVNLDLEDATVADARIKYTGFIARLHAALSLTYASKYLIGRRDQESLSCPTEPDPVLAPEPAPAP
jgi:hypothetical protein